MKNIPVYRFPAEHARENGELELYRASNKASAACKEAIEKAISEHYCDNVLHREAVAQVAEQFGHERILYPLFLNLCCLLAGLRFLHHTDKLGSVMLGILGNSYNDVDGLYTEEWQPKVESFFAEMADKDNLCLSIAIDREILLDKGEMGKYDHIWLSQTEHSSNGLLPKMQVGVSHQSGLLPQDEGETGRLPPAFRKTEAETIN